MKKDETKSGKKLYVILGILSFLLPLPTVILSLINEGEIYLYILFYLLYHWIFGAFFLFFYDSDLKKTLILIGSLFGILSGVFTLETYGHPLITILFSSLFVSLIILTFKPNSLFMVIGMIAALFSLNIPLCIYIYSIPLPKKTKSKPKNVGLFARLAAIAGGILAIVLVNGKWITVEYVIKNYLTDRHDSIDYSLSEISDFFDFVNRYFNSADGLSQTIQAFFYGIIILSAVVILMALINPKAIRIWSVLLLLASLALYAFVSLSISYVTQENETPIIIAPVTPKNDIDYISTTINPILLICSSLLCVIAPSIKDSRPATAAASVPNTVIVTQPAIPVKTNYVADETAKPLEPEKTEKMICSECGEVIPDGNKFCGKCGAVYTPPKKRICSDCGEEIPDGNKFCGKCGAVYKEKDDSNKVCPSCGEIHDTEVSFCRICGTKIKQ